MPAGKRRRRVRPVAAGRIPAQRSADAPAYNHIELYYQASRDAFIAQTDLMKGISARGFNFVSLGFATLAAAVLAVNLKVDKVADLQDPLVMVAGGMALGSFAALLFLGLFTFPPTWVAYPLTSSALEIGISKNASTARRVIAKGFARATEQNRLALKKITKLHHWAFFALLCEVSSILIVIVAAVLEG